jgi:hypothetical protein
LRELSALQNQLRDGTKFEKLVQYRCANLFFLIVPNDLFHPAEIPIGWGALVEDNGALRLARKPVWRQTSAQDKLGFLHRIAVAGTRQVNRKLEITFEEILASRAQFSF